ncbi:hypothetical protein BH11PSE2_BH11PSE2_21040 [soil metagenome]
MFSKIVLMLAGLALIAGAVLLWRPDLFPAGVPHLQLREDYRSNQPLLIIAEAFLGAVIFLGALVRPLSRKADRPGPVFALAPEPAPEPQPVFDAEGAVAEFHEAAPEPEVEAPPAQTERTIYPPV